MTCWDKFRLFHTVGCNVKVWDSAPWAWFVNNFWAIIFGEHISTITPSSGPSRPTKAKTNSNTYYIYRGLTNYKYTRNASSTQINGLTEPSIILYHIHLLTAQMEQSSACLPTSFFPATKIGLKMYHYEMPCFSIACLWVGLFSEIPGTIFASYPRSNPPGNCNGWPICKFFRLTEWDLLCIRYLLWGEDQLICSMCPSGNVTFEHWNFLCCLSGVPSWEWEWGVVERRSANLPLCVNL